MSFADSYGVFDRLLHRFAFATTWAQRGVADLEQKLFRRELDAVDPGAPVFVTALPRAGTTILLELLAGLDEFASHRYRDMPFVLTPMLWSRFVGSGDRDAAPQERAHGDGIQISQDSPEAFEEMLWRAFWKSHYKRDRIAPWSRCDEPEFVEFLVAHMRKVIALRAREKRARFRFLPLSREEAKWSFLEGALLRFEDSTRRMRQPPLLPLLPLRLRGSRRSWERSG